MTDNFPNTGGKKETSNPRCIYSPFPGTKQCSRTELLQPVMSDATEVYSLIYVVLATVIRLRKQHLTANNRGMPRNAIQLWVFQPNKRIENLRIKMMSLQAHFENSSTREQRRAANIILNYHFSNANLWKSLQYVLTATQASKELSAKD